MNLDTHIPHRGPCAFCGGPDARHRILDAIRDRHKAGEHIDDLATDYHLPREVVGEIVGEEQPHE